MLILNWQIFLIYNNNNNKIDRGKKSLNCFIYLLFCGWKKSEL